MAADACREPVKLEQCHECDHVGMPLSGNVTATLPAPPLSAPRYNADLSEAADAGRAARARLRILRYVETAA